MGKSPPPLNVVLHRLHETFQMSILEVFTTSFPMMPVEIHHTIQPSRVPQLIFSSTDSQDHLLSSYPERIPLFLFVHMSPSSLPVLELMDRHRVFDYALTSDAPEIIKSRVALFIKKALEEPLEDSGPPSSPWWRTLVEALTTILVRLFRARAVTPSVECSTVIGNRWVRLRRLGFGSFSEVWLVQRKGTISEHLAVAKIPHDARSNEKFLHEAHILRKLQDHPNAVQLIEVIEHSGKTILIEEFVEGKTLQEAMNEGMSSTEKEQAFSAILDMVAYAHDHHIMHRDIKPENILITPGGTIKVLDFGTAKDVSSRSISNTVIGSRPYMAPEQIRGESRIASDVWALGVLLYALATDYVPFYSENEKELMDMILESPPEPPRRYAPELVPALEEIILRCLEKNWHQRFATARDLRHTLFEMLPDFGKGNYIP